MVRPICRRRESNLPIGLYNEDYVKVDGGDGGDMVAAKTKIILGLLAVEFSGCSAWYLLSDGGIREQLALKRECTAVERKIADAKCEIEHIKKDLALWKEDPFYIEQYAREKLAMSKPDDELFVY